MSKLTVHNIPSINEFEVGSALIDPLAPIWYSTFGEKKWVYNLPNDPLYKGPKFSSIEWNDYLYSSSSKHSSAKYEHCLTPRMILEIQIAAFMYAHYPKLFRGTKTKKTMLDGKTVKGRVVELAKIGSHIVRASLDEGVVIESFSDINFEMLRRHASSIGGRPDHLKRAMRLIATEVVQRNLPQLLQIKLADVDSKSINWGAQVEWEGIPTLSDAQFLFLLNYCKQAIAEFKIAMGFDIHDKDIIDAARADVLDKLKDIRVSLEDYIWGNSGRGDISGITAVYREAYGYTPGDITSLYKDAHKASMLAIMLMTGMRDTEFSLLMVGSLKYIDGLKFLVSKVIKQQYEGSPLKDRWLAIPLVEDAYDVLSYACKKTGNTYLFSSPTRVRDEGQGYAELNPHFNRFIQNIDQHKLFEGYLFSVHQCRESLAYQLAKHKVGLPFISKQLKHFHNRFDRMPNAVTAGYGNYKKDLQFSIGMRMASARESVLIDMFGEDKQFAGGGGEIHKNRIDAWFKGVGLFGEARVKYLKKMANSNISLMPTSIGVCNHNFIDMADDELPPPCYGDFSCDPECPNHVISEGCASALKDRQKHALKKANEDKNNYKIWIGLAEQLEKHVSKFERDSCDDR
jgi:hypothetical protein